MRDIKDIKNSVRESINLWVGMADDDEIMMEYELIDLDCRWENVWEKKGRGEYNAYVKSFDDAKLKRLSTDINEILTRCTSLELERLFESVMPPFRCSKNSRDTWISLLECIRSEMTRRINVPN